MYKPTLQKVKQSVQRMEEHLRFTGHNVPHSTLLHAFAKALFFRNWNTMQAALAEPEVFDPKSIYTLRIGSDQNRAKVLQTIHNCAQKAHCVMDIKHTQQYPQFLEIRFTNPPTIGADGWSYSNLLTMLMLLSETIKSERWLCETLEYWHERVERQDFLEAVRPKTTLKQ